MTILCSPIFTIALSAFEESLIYWITKPLWTTFFLPEEKDIAQCISCFYPLCKIYHFTLFFDLIFSYCLLYVEFSAVLHDFFGDVDVKIIKAQTVHKAYYIG